eukprot:GHUV01044115.1.p1 GENE.GHUV01044115.1~~GHUV01044115.1.p1  ORF type:complete len:154 (-),score=24.92 GHUV01044115.1:14-421(-)
MVPTDVPSGPSSQSCNNLCQTWLASGERLGAVRPSTELLAAIDHSTSLLADLADAVMSYFPLPVCCNSPLCSDLAKLSEWQLVCGKACVCAGCEVARYCSEACQRQHWKQHRLICRQLNAQQPFKGLSEPSQSIM